MQAQLVRRSVFLMMGLFMALAALPQERENVGLIPDYLAVGQVNEKALWYSCTGWGNRWVDSGKSFTFYFSPGIKGTHKIVFGNGPNVLNAGNLSFYWRNTQAGVNSWQYFDTLSVERDPVQERKLYSGSRDVEYRFIYRATRSATFGWSLCTG
jgi:hypothetical protein